MGSPHQRSTKVHGCQESRIGEGPIQGAWVRANPGEGMEVLKDEATRPWEWTRLTFEAESFALPWDEMKEKTQYQLLCLILSTLRHRNRWTGEGRYVSLTYPGSANNCLAQKLLDSDLVWGRRWIASCFLNQHYPESENRLKSCPSEKSSPKPRLWIVSPFMDFVRISIISSSWFFFTTVWFKSEDFVPFIFISTTQHNAHLIKPFIGKGIRRQSEFQTMVAN